MLMQVLVKIQTSLAAALAYRQLCTHPEPQAPALQLQRCLGKCLRNPSTPAALAKIPGIGIGTRGVHALCVDVVAVESRPPVAIGVLWAVIDEIVWRRAITPLPSPIVGVTGFIGQADPIGS